MFSRRTEARSIASQLVWLFTLAATLLLSCGLGVFYWMVVLHAFAEDNAILADKTAALSADLKEGGLKNFGEELNAPRAGESAAYWIRVLDSEARTVAETPERPPSDFKIADMVTAVSIEPPSFLIPMVS